MPSTNINPQQKNFTTSCFTLKSTAFDQTNYRSGGAPPNDTLSADTPKGVLAGSVASYSADWEADVGKHNSLALIGLFSDNSEGSPFENSPAPASGKVAIYCGMGFFDLFTFETHSFVTAYPSILANYTIGAKLYASAFGLVTNEVPTVIDGVPADGVDTILGYVTAVPITTNLKMGLKLIL